MSSLAARISNVKGIGAVIAAVLALGSLAFAGDLGPIIAIPGLMFAGVLVAIFWVFGVVVTAQGQLLRATLDTAVNGSPFLDREQQARVMGVHAD